jgi:hypothetical protein
VDEATLKVGLLMEAAQTQQKAVDALLQRLTDHLGGLDAVVREEMRRAFSQEFQALGTASETAADALHQIRRAAGRRTALWVVAVTMASAVAPCLVSWTVLPSRAEVANLRAQRNELAQSIADLEHEAGHIDLRRCGDYSRLCVRVDRSAPVYGANGDYLVVRGP